MELFFGSGNAGKLKELLRLVEGLPIRVVTAATLGRPLPEVEEDGDTFQANAEKKARAFAAFAGMLALADDSGLCVDALDGAPGVRSARWSDDEAPGLVKADRDHANNAKLLRALAGRPDAERGGGYVAVLVLARPAGEVVATVEGRCRGRIGHSPRGTGGFGFDPLFVPEGGDSTMAELSPEAKDAISHRGKAFRALRPALARLAALDAGMGTG
jgi:XTP/dITP diphosphohydrolase